MSIGDIVRFNGKLFVAWYRDSRGWWFAEARRLLSEVSDNWKRLTDGL